MESGFYTSAVGMLAQFNIEDNISNNLANLQTPGFKGRVATVQDFSQTLLSSQQSFGPINQTVSTPIGQFGLPPSIQSYGMDLSQGAPRHTGAPLNAMIAGNGFFTVQNGNQTLLTRNGTFHRSATGQLLTAEGYAVLGAAGTPITLPQGTVTIGRQGVIQVDGKVVDRLGMAQVPVGTPLQDAGAGYFSGQSTPVPANAPGVAVLQGYLEGSNVDMTTQTSSLLAAQRAYQADSQMLQIEDTTMGLAVNDLGKVG